MDEPQHQWKPLSCQGGDIASSSAELRTGRGNKARAPPRTSIFESDTDSESEAPREIVHVTLGKMANFDIWDPYPHRERINMTRIAPVAVGGGNGAFAMPMFGDPVMMQVMRNLVQPTFKGVRDEWPKFVVQWEKYLAKLSQGKPIPD